MTGQRKERITMSRASDVVSIALAEVGYVEKASNTALDSPSANPGAANFTKYARDLANAGYYNGNKNGYAWCDVFVDWCFFKASGKAEGQRIQCQTGDLGAGCTFSAQYFRQQGRYDRNPMVGDQVFFQSGGEISHTGIVVKVTDAMITTVEGNSGDSVKQNSYKKTNSYIAGYGHPKYDDTDTVTEETETVIPQPTPALAEPKATVTIELEELSTGSVGGQVKTIQRIIYVRGINAKIVIDGEFGPITKAGVVELQKVLFPKDESEWDSIVGKKTWTAVLTSLV